MSKLGGVATLLALTWGCAQRSAAPAETPASATSPSSASEPQAAPPEVTPMPTPTPSAEKNEEPATSNLKLAQARAMGCVGIR